MLVLYDNHYIIYGAIGTNSAKKPYITTAVLVRSNSFHMSQIFWNEKQLLQNLKVSIRRRFEQWFHFLFAFHTSNSCESYTRTNCGGHWNVCVFNATLFQLSDAITWLSLFRMWIQLADEFGRKVRGIRWMHQTAHGNQKVNDFLFNHKMRDVSWYFHLFQFSGNISQAVQSHTLRADRAISFGLFNAHCSYDVNRI